MDADTDRLPALADRLRRAASDHGTPCYVTDAAALAAAARELEAAFPDPWIRQFSIKANDVPAIIAELAGLGLGANVVSRGEWARARRAGLPNESITLEGVGKNDADLRAAVSAARRGKPLRWVAVESPEEVEALATFARRAHVAIDVLFRLNPDVAPETPAGLDVGSGVSKFGMTETELTRAVQRLDGVGSGGLGGLRPRGIHLHVGSQLGAIDAWRDGLRRAVAVLGLVRGSLPHFDTLDVGGGFPVAPFGSGSRVPAPGRFAREVPALLEAVPADRRPLRLAVEPGRFLVARAGWIVARVLHVRDRGARLAVIDAGMAELIRPALYGAVHPVVALTSMGEPVDDAGPAVSLRPEYDPTRVDGPICESTDTLGVHSLPPLRRGDLVAIRDAGAYAASMSSAYNGRPHRAQVLLR